MQRSSSTVHRGSAPADTAGATSQRVRAADNTPSSHAGRSSSPTVPPASAASCRRRDSVMSSPDPSPTTTATPALRSARSSAHKRSARPGASTNNDRANIPPAPRAIAPPCAQTRRPTHTHNNDPPLSPSALPAAPSAASRATPITPPRGALHRPRADRAPGSAPAPGSVSGSAANHSCTPTPIAPPNTSSRPPTSRRPTPCASNRP